jgi:acetoin utilization protein AcuB
MLVRDVMSAPVLTIPPSTTLRDAAALLHERSIRHLPVVEEGRLVGVITDRDLRCVTSTLCESPYDAGAPVARAMARPPVTADPMDAVEEAARAMRERKIGCLPVVQDGSVVGIVTGMDLLDAIIRMAGAGLPSGRMEVVLADRPGELARLTGLLGQRNVNIHAILTYPDGEGVVRTVLRLDSIETRRLAEALRETGFEVLWPPRKPWQR